MPLGESWIYSMGQKNGLHAFGYNSTESEPILMKFGTLWATWWGLALADFGRDPHSSAIRAVVTVWEGAKFFCPVNNAHKGSLLVFPKMQTLLKIFPGLVTSGHHNSTMITNVENTRLNCHPMGCLVFILKLKSIQCLSPGWYAAYKITFPARISALLQYGITYAIEWTDYGQVIQ